jgi:chemotaxis protein CheX
MGAAPNTQGNIFFDKALINAFIDGLIKTLGDMAQTKVIPGKPTIEGKVTVKGEVAGIIGLVAGQAKGTLLICFSSRSAFKIIENMLGEIHTDLTPEVTDAVGELTNMIYGSAKTTLNKMGYQFEMAIPTVITGDFQISGSHNGVTLSIPFTIEPDIQLFIEIIVQQ